MRFKLFHDGNINYLMIINSDEKKYLITDNELIIEVFRSKEINYMVDSIIKEIAYDNIRMLNDIGYERIM